MSDCPIYDEGTALLREALIFAGERPDLVDKLSGALLHGYMARINHSLLCDACIEREIRAILSSTPGEQ